LSKYEAVFILDPTKVEGNGEAFGKTIEEQIQALGGTLCRIKCLDKRQFARPIGKSKAGIYWDYVVELEANAVDQLKEKYRLNQTVLRLVVFSYTDGQDDYVFAAPQERAFLHEENFQDEFDRDERPYRNFRDK